METFFNEVNNAQIPKLLVVVGLILIFLGVVTKFNAIEVQPQLRKLSIFIGSFLVALGLIGLILTFFIGQGNTVHENYDSKGNDITGLPLHLNRENCVKTCKSNSKCSVVAVSTDGECWLKTRMSNLTENPSRSVIEVKK